NIQHVNSNHRLAQDFLHPQAQLFSCSIKDCAFLFAASVPNHSSGPGDRRRSYNLPVLPIVFWQRFVWLVENS
ncbi:MAG TPA: hypothetical protein PLO28_07140, partial [bacterium]|nr:hypothetical protein [bacterium]